MAIRPPTVPNRVVPFAVINTRPAATTIAAMAGPNHSRPKMTVNRGIKMMIPATINSVWTTNGSTTPGTETRLDGSAGTLTRLALAKWAYRVA